MRIIFWNTDRPSLQKHKTTLLSLISAQGYALSWYLITIITSNNHFIDPFVQTLWQQRNFSSLFCLSCMESSFSFMSILSQRRQTLKNTNTSRIPFKYMDLSFATLWSILLCWPEMKQWEKLSGRRPRWVFAKTKLELQNRFITDSGPKLKSIYK